MKYINCISRFLKVVNVVLRPLRVRNNNHFVAYSFIRRLNDRTYQVLSPVMFLSPVQKELIFQDSNNVHTF